VARCTPWRGTPYSWHAIREAVQHTSLCKCTQLCVHSTTFQRVWCLRPRFLVLSHCAEDGVDSDLSAWWGEACGTSQVFFKTLILGGMHPHSAYRTLIHPAHLCAGSGHNTSRTTTRCRQVHRVVYVASLGACCSKSDLQALQLYKYDVMRHIALLSEGQQLRWCLSSSFGLLRAPQRGPLIDAVHLICATQPGISHTSPIHVQSEGWCS